WRCKEERIASHMVRTLRVTEHFTPVGSVAQMATAIEGLGPTVRWAGDGIISLRDFQGRELRKTRPFVSSRDCLQEAWGTSVYTLPRRCHYPQRDCLQEAWDTSVYTLPRRCHYPQLDCLQEAWDTSVYTLPRRATTLNQNLLTTERSGSPLSIRSPDAGINSQIVVKKHADVNSVRVFKRRDVTKTSSQSLPARVKFSERRTLVNKWKPLFDQYDPYRRGEILIEDFAYLLRHPQIRAEMDAHTLDVLEVKASEPCRTTVSYQEFVNLLSNRRNPSFRLAVESRVEGDMWTGSVCLRGEAGPPTCFQRMVRRLAKDFLIDEADRRYYADRYTCCPPPLFVPIITLLETAGTVEVYTLHAASRRLRAPVVVGIPLEMVHGSFRIFIVYMAGVLAGSLGTSVFDMNAFLVGASGGVYALLAAHLANILLNYSQMELGVLKLAAVLIIASADVGFAIWDRYTYKELSPPVGYTAHLMGALAGLTIGLVVLKNFEQKLHEQYVWWIALAVYLGCVVFAIFWNIFYY
ncbi:hypothetical protein BaRGS_00001348, partial [Batillaria attramentaria]